MSKNFVWQRVGDFYINVFGKNNPSNEEWESSNQEFRTLGVWTSVKGILLYSEGGSPTGLQRKSARNLMESTNFTPPSALLTNNTAVRLTLTALNRVHLPNYRPESLL